MFPGRENDSERAFPSRMYFNRGELYLLVERVA